MRSLPVVPLCMTYWVLMMVANAVSVIAGAWILLKITSLPHTLRRRSLLKTMLYSAASDVLFHSLNIVAHWTIPQPLSFRLWTFCAFALSMFFELTCCVLFLLRSYRNFPFLSAWLPLFPIAAAAATTGVLAFQLHLHDDGEAAQVMRHFIMFDGLLCATSSASCLCLVVAAVRANSCGDIAKRRSSRLSAIFAANALITEVPHVVVNLGLRRGDFGDQEVFIQTLVFAAGILLSLSGAANVCTFFLPSRYSRDPVLGIAHNGKVSSFDVRWSEPEVRELPAVADGHG